MTKQESTPPSAPPAAPDRPHVYDGSQCWCGEYSSVQPQYGKGHQSEGPAAQDTADAVGEARKLRDVLRRHGFVECDIAACNCGSWHQRYGWPERMREIREALTEAGHPPSNDNGNLTINALKELIAELARLRSAGGPHD